jgi:hypothetical protein
MAPRMMRPLLVAELVVRGGERGGEEGAMPVTSESILVRILAD